MSVEFKTLQNGIKIINDKIDVESASIGVWVGAGSSNEKKDECGIIISGKLLVRYRNKKKNLQRNY